MSVASGVSWPKRIALVTGGLLFFTLFFVIALRMTVTEMTRGIETSRATGLAATTSWDLRSQWSTLPVTGPVEVDQARANTPWESTVARRADLMAHSNAFDQSVARLRQLVTAHQGFFEDLRTQSQSGSGRALSATLAVPAKEFDATLSDLKQLGRVEAVAESGEDSVVKLATAGRHVAAAQTNLERLQKLQRERRGELRDAVALEKDIAQANEMLADAERQHQALLSTIAQAHIRFTLIEDYRAPLEANLAGNLLALRNSAVEGIGAIISSLAVILGVVFEYGLPLLFWLVILFLPGRYAWRRLRRASGSLAAQS